MSRTDEPTRWGGPEVLHTDYEQTNQLYRMLVDIRFKLLTFVPTVTGVVLGVLGNRALSPSEGKQGSGRLVLTVGVVGLLVTLGIIAYEIRNSQIHDNAIHRLKHLEKLLGLRPAVQKPGPGGFFDERGNRIAFLGLVSVWHDRALALVYGTAVGVWTLLICSGVSTLTAGHPWAAPEWICFLPILVGLLIGYEIIRLSDMGRSGAIIYTIGHLEIVDVGDLENICQRAEGKRRLHLRKDHFLGEAPSWCKFPDEDPLRGRIKPVFEMACGLGLIETTRMTIWLRARPSATWLLRRDEERKNRRRRCRLTDRGRAFIHPKTNDDERKQLLLRGLLEGVIGCEELVCGDGSALRPKDRATRRLRTRYGDDAPWCSDEEVVARLKWLRRAGAR